VVGRSGGDLTRSTILSGSIAVVDIVVSIATRSVLLSRSAGVTVIMVIGKVQRIVAMQSKKEAMKRPVVELKL